MKKQSDQITREEAAQTEVLSGVDFELVETLLASCPIRALEPAEILMSPGEQSNSMFLILSGSLRVHVDAIDADPIALLQAGTSVGELSSIDDHPRSAYVVCCTSARLLEISQKTFWALSATSHTVAFNMLRLLSRRFRGNNSTLLESFRLQQEYKRHASVDALTGLYNRRWLDEVLPRQMLRSSISNQPLSLMMLDVDHFKKFNDTYGHQAGDFVLFALGKILRDRFRPTDLVARYGGEEFTAILPNTPLEGALTAAERVREFVCTTALTMPDNHGGVTLPALSISLGITTMRPEESMDTFIERADHALYRAKEEGRNRSVLAAEAPL